MAENSIIKILKRLTEAVKNSDCISFDRIDELKKESITVDNWKNFITNKNVSVEAALYITASLGNLELVKYLVEEKRQDINAKDHQVWTASHYAACSGNLELVKCLVEKKSNINAHDADGETALSLVLVSMYSEIAKFLTEYLIEKKFKYG